MDKKKSRNPKGMGSYRKLKNGSHQWRRRMDGEEQTITRKSKQDLQAEVNKVSDLPLAKSKVKVCQIFEKYLENVKKLNSKATYDQYSFIYKKHIKPPIGNRMAIKITSTDIQSVIADMNVTITLPERRDKEGNVIREAKIGCSTWTMKHARKIMHLAFESAVMDKLIPENPVKNIIIPKKQPKERKTLNVNELAKLFLSLEGSRWKHSAWFLLLTAMRRGEMLALAELDIDEINMRITVDESNSRAGLDGTKGRKIHYVPLTNEVKECLRKQRQMLDEEDNPVLIKPDLKKTGLIFPNIHGEMLNPNSYYTIIARAAKKGGIHVSPHCLRHTFVYFNRKKLSRSELQAILGHESETSTYDIYGKMLDESMDTTAQQISEVFKQVNKDIEEQQEKIKAENSKKVINFEAFKKAK